MSASMPSFNAAIVPMLVLSITLFASLTCAQDRDTNAPAGELVLAEGGQARAVIVVADRPDLTPFVPRRGDENDPERVYATVDAMAHYLAARLKQATGAEFTVVAEADAPAEGLLILVGTSDLSKRFGFDGAALDKPEEVRIAAFERGVAIYGNRLPARERGALVQSIDNLFQVRPLPPEGAWADRATLHAVGQFLEHIGYRFYFPMPEDLGLIVPAVERLAVPRDLDIRNAPAFLYRFGMAGRVGNWPFDEGYIYARQGGSIELGVNHIFNINANDYPNRPDLFAKDEDGNPQADRRLGEPPVYGSPEVVDLFIEHVRRFDREGIFYRPRRGRRIMATPHRVLIGPADGRWIDHDPRSQRWFQPERHPVGSQSDLLGWFGAEVAQRVEAEWPGRRVTLMMQNNYAEAPSERIQLPDNVDVLTCVSIRATLMNVQNAYREYSQKFIDDWHKALGGDRARLAIWDYPPRPQGWVKFPAYAPRMLQDWYQTNREKIGGTFLNGSGREIGLPMSALWTDLLWNPDLDIEAWHREFTEKMFGPAAGVMYDWIMLAADRYETVQWADAPWVSNVRDGHAYRQVFPPGIVAQLRAMFDQALELAGADADERYLKRLQWMYSEGGEHGIEAFFKASEEFHRPRAATPVEAQRVAEGDVTLDGILNEAFWENAAARPLLEEDAHGTLFPARDWWTTEVRAAYSPEALYIAFRCRGDVEPLMADGQRLNPATDDHVTVLIRNRAEAADEEDIFLEIADLQPTEAEKRRLEMMGIYRVRVNAKGVTDDLAVAAQVSVDRGTYTVELRIPRERIEGMGEAWPETLPVDFRRHVARRAELPQLPRGFRYATHADRMAELRLLRP